MDAEIDAEGEHHLLFVPVHECAAGTLALRTGRLPSGQRVGLAFTSEASLLLALGPCQPWMRLDEGTMRDMLTPIGIDHIRIDACTWPAQAPTQRVSVPSADRPIPIGAARTARQSKGAVCTMPAPPGTQAQLVDAGAEVGKARQPVVDPGVSA